MTAAVHFSESDWLSCCGSSKFAKQMARIGPFQSVSEAIDMSRHVWFNKVDIPGWLEAFAAHPKIGDIKALSSKSAANPDWSEGEQSAALSTANDRLLKDLAEWNRQYEAKFGFVFLVCASGKSSTEILQLLKARMTNRPLVELQVAANEQQKITELRLTKLVTESQVYEQPQVPPKLEEEHEQQRHGSFRTGDSKTDGRLNKIEAHVAPARPPITTHVLDVSLGKPACGIEVSLEFLKDSNWISIGSSVTNQDGRSGALMEPSDRTDEGTYRLVFNTGKYHNNSGTDSFYPYVSVVFDINPSQVSQHFHVPLLLSPFSFTTYRGS